MSMFRSRAEWHAFITRALGRQAEALGRQAEPAASRPAPRRPLLPPPHELAAATTARLKEAREELLAEKIHNAIMRGRK